MPAFEMVVHFSKKVSDFGIVHADTSQFLQQNCPGGMSYYCVPLSATMNPVPHFKGVYWWAQSDFETDRKKVLVSYELLTEVLRQLFNISDVIRVYLNTPPVTLVIEQTDLNLVKA